MQLVVLKWLNKMADRKPSEPVKPSQEVKSDVPSILTNADLKMIFSELNKTLTMINGELKAVSDNQHKLLEGMRILNGNQVELVKGFEEFMNGSAEEDDCDCGEECPACN